MKPVISERIDNHMQDWALPSSIKQGWVGEVDSTAPTGLFASGDLDDVLKVWDANITIEAPSICEGLCTGSLNGAGIAINCNSSVQNIDLTLATSNGAILFDLTFSRTFSADHRPLLDMQLSYMSEADQQCRATIAIQHCSMQLATVAYDTIQQGYAVQLDTTRYPRVVEITPSVSDDTINGNPASALSALNYFPHYYLEGNATSMQPNTPGGQFAWEPYGTVCRQHADFPTFEEAKNRFCALRWRNATEDVLWKMHKVMFRLAVTSALGNETGAVSMHTCTRSVMIYEARYGTLWVAIGTMLLALLAAMSLFWGFWQLDRAVSMSPVEMARALAGTVLSFLAGDIRMDFEELLEVVGHKNVGQMSI